eukprot:TRINITY_DN9256_c0_g1_i2.p1 TRINITY_DN9256_c0_g1~~TRINITY_DN9256_c0_g1_i2.p1  ORF type:complete len:656 (+),score=194.49 TRINITY_DN9256_c0_g1_i2:44-2011(+)
MFVSYNRYLLSLFFFLMIRRPPRSTLSSSSAASDVYKRQVLKFLKDRGYAFSARCFEKERTISLEKKTLLSGAKDQASQSGAICFHRDEEPGVYIEQYRKLREYVSNSLDMYKVELEQLLFPIFVHCFLEMIKRSHAEMAAEFFKEHEHDHVFLYKSEVDALRGLSTPEHLEANSQAKMYLEHKFGLRMASHTFRILRSFLHDNKLVLVLSIVNEHINIDVFSGDPEVAGVQDTMVVGLTGYEEGSPACQQELNNTTILWGALETPAVATHRRDLKEAALAAQTGDGMPPPPSKKLKVGEEETTTINMSDSQVPLPELTDMEWEAELLELRAAAKVSPAALPSVCCYTLFNTHGMMTSVELSRNAAKVVMGTSESVVYTWDLQKLSEKPQPGEDPAVEDKRRGPHVHVGHSGPVYSANFSPDNRFLLTGSEDKTARLWSLETDSCLVAYKGHNYPVWDAKFAPLGVYFATASHDRTARIWSCDHIHPLRILAGHLSDVDCLAWHPNCNYLATGSSDKTLRLWDIQSGQCVRLFTGHHGSLTCCSISPCGGYLASAGEDSNVMLWDLGSGKRVASYQGHTKTVWSLDFSQESAVLASGSADGTVRLWDVASGRTQGVETEPVMHEPLKTLPTKSTPISLVRFSSRNVLLAAGVYEG